MDWKVGFELEQIFNSPFHLLVPSQFTEPGSLGKRVPEISCHPEVEGLLIRPLVFCLTKPTHPQLPNAIQEKQRIGIQPR